MVDVRRRTVLCLGEALIDLAAVDGSTLQTAQSLSLAVGGAPLNVAIHLNRMGVAAHYLGTLSTDGFGARIRTLLEREGIPRSPAPPVDGPTRLAVIERTCNGQSFRFYGDNTADTMLTVGHVEDALESRPQALYLSSLLMTHPATNRVQRIAIEQARNMDDCLIVCDPNPRPPAWRSGPEPGSTIEFLVENSDLIKLSVEDARTLGWPDDPGSLLIHLSRRTSGTVVVTDGARGSWFMIESELCHVPAPKIVEVDPTGAGDAYFAAIIAGFVRERRLTTAIVTKATETGALIASRHGAH